MRKGHLLLLFIPVFAYLVHFLPAGASSRIESSVSTEANDNIFQLLRIEPYVTGFVKVTDIAHAGDERLFVAQLQGKIQIVNGEGVLEPQNFLDIRDRVSRGMGENGLVSLAFHPDYTDNGYFFVVYTNLNGDSVVSRFRVSADPDVADPTSEEFILTLPQPDPTHNIDDLTFGTDGYLYIGIGDGGPVSDIYHQGQNLQSLYGSIIRLDVDDQLPYTIPPDNPFVGNAEALDEIFVYGFRNPWRISMDPLTNHLFIGDVGENSYEELMAIPAGEPAGQNLGWSCYEGPGIFNPAQCSDTVQYTFPIFSYTHRNGCAVIAGPVYRGLQFPALQGHLLYTDFCSGVLNALVQDIPGSWRLAYASSTGLDLWTTFGTDAQGEIYLGRYGETIYRVMLVSVELPQKNYLPHLP